MHPSTESAGLTPEDHRRKALDRYEMSINTQSGMCQGKVEQGYPEKALAISEK